MATSDLNMLIDMGFEQEKAELAVKKTGNLQSALDWLDKNADKSAADLKAEEESSQQQQQQQQAGKAAADDNDDEDGPALKPGEEARSLVCNECGKKFRSTAQAEFHASKSSHTDFAESTEEIAPLTEEERAAKLEALKQKLAAKRAAQGDQDKEERKRNEEIRRRATKEGQDIKEDLQKREQVKEAAKKRAEKAADADARKAILAKIEADKAERRRKADLEKAQRAGQPLPVEPGQSQPAAAAAAAAVPAAPKPSSAYTDARLRLQTPRGTLTKTFPAGTTLFEVAHAVAEEQGGGAEVTSFTQNFPRKVFDATDFGMTLKEAGWVPSAALILK